jgi:hypothetical protein
MIDSEDLKQRLSAALTPHGHLPYRRATADDLGCAGWSLFVFADLGEAALMWGDPGDHDRIEQGISRSFEERVFRIGRMTAIGDLLNSLGGWQTELRTMGEVASDTAQLMITRVPA